MYVCMYVCMYIIFRPYYLLHLIFHLALCTHPVSIGENCAPLTLVPPDNGLRTCPGQGSDCQVTCHPGYRFYEAPSDVIEYNCNEDGILENDVYGTSVPNCIGKQDAWPFQYGHFVYVLSYL